MRTLAFLAVAAGLTLAAPAHAQSAADDADLKCLLVVGAIADSASATDQMKQYAPVAFGYYYGKLKGRSPSLDIQGRLLTVAGGFKPADLQTEAVRCGGELQALGAETKALGEKFKSMSGGAPAPK